MDEGTRRRVAQGLFRVAGWVSRIHVPHRKHKIVSFDPFETEPAGWTWSSAPFTYWLLNQSMQLDWDHWDHWALDHGDEELPTCPTCGHPQCDYEEQP